MKEQVAVSLQNAQLSYVETKDVSYGDYGPS
jgi:hypothetical protein